MYNLYAMIIGLVGFYCSGKDTIAEYLVKKKGFSHYSLSGILTEELKARGIKPTRDKLIKSGNGLRKKSGHSILAKMALKKCAGDGDYVISSIRHPAEVEELSERKDFYLVDVKAPAKLRFRRMLERKREGDPLTFEDFLEYEKSESRKNGSGQQLEVCKKIATRTINNAGSIKVLRSKIDKLLA